MGDNLARLIEDIEPKQAVEILLEEKIVAESGRSQQVF